MRFAFRGYTAPTVACVALALFMAACAAPREDALRYVVTIHPLAAILCEITGDRAEIQTLLGAGASPHTYELRPSDARRAEAARAVFYVDPELDGWAARLPNRERVAVFALTPEEMRLPWDWEHDDHGHAHDHGHHHNHDAHFWSDPMLVQALLPGLVAELSRLDPEGASGYAANAARFSAELDALDAELAAKMAPLEGALVVLFHPSWNYFLKRYGLELVGLVEPAPGKEVSAQYLRDLVRDTSAQSVKAVFYEPQLPRRPAEVLAEAAGAPLYELDPNGGGPGRKTYRDLLMYNAGKLREALL